MRRLKPSKFSLLALLVVFGWLAIGGVTGPISGKLTEVQSNSNSEFLPANSETTVVSQRLEAFTAQGSVNYLPMTLAFERPAGFTAADQTKFAGLVQQIIGLPDVKQYLAYVEVPGLGKVPSVFPATPEQFGQAISKDGQALVINVNLDFAKLADDKGAFQKIGKVAGQVQELVDKQQLGADGYVTGAVGIFAEFASAFAGIDGTLLLTTLGVVALILILVYRSPILWVIPLLSAGLSLGLAAGIIYYLALNDIIKLNGQSQGILSVLVLGAATDYALLLVSRYREELHQFESKWDAIRVSLRSTWEPIAASAGTVTVGLMCLELSELRSNAGLGPVGAVGVLSSLAVTLTFLPALLGLAGRRVFWPFVPKHDEVAAVERGVWAKVAKFVGQRARAAWIVSTAVLLVMAWGVTTLQATGIATADVFRDREAKPLVGLRVLEAHGLTPPNVDATIVAKADKLPQVIEAAKQVASVQSVTPRVSFTSGAPVVINANGYSAADVTFTTEEAQDPNHPAVADLRNAVRAIGDADALVGGSAAADYDVQQASLRDREVIIPVILVVITLILMLLLRSLLAPLLLVATVVLSFGAAMGASAFVFNHIFKFAGADASYPLFAFVFLVALGIDYNIFLMTRVREESIRLGTRRGTLKALAVTGGVITSAGVVLAATFSVLGIIPLVFLAELGFAVAFGVLLDTLLVRSVLVPALAHDIGQRIWWPSKLARAESEPAGN